MGEPNPPVAADDARRIGLRTIAPATALVGLSLALGIGGQVLLRVCEVIAHGLLSPGPYVAAIIGGGS